ncbi:MAG TPA: SDR family oxidoreductase [Puia sp.]
MNRVLLAGATGHLGSFILTELLSRGLQTRAIARNAQKLSERSDSGRFEIIQADVTDLPSLAQSCENIDTVISTIGITRQKDGLTYMDVDYQANLNLLREAKLSGVKKFIYISVFNGDRMRHLKICEAKERFVDVLKGSGLEYFIVRPTGYFSDMGEFYKMAAKGRVYLFGAGQHSMNPIHCADLAKVCVDAISSDAKEVPVGGPQVLTYNQIADLAFSVAGKKKKIIHIPNWLRKAILSLLRTFTSSKTYGPVEFLLTVLAIDLIAPAFGSRTLEEYFRSAGLS